MTRFGAFGRDASPRTVLEHERQKKTVRLIPLAFDPTYNPTSRGQQLRSLRVNEHPRLVAAPVRARPALLCARGIGEPDQGTQGWNVEGPKELLAVPGEPVLPAVGGEVYVDARVVLTGTGGAVRGSVVGPVAVALAEVGNAWAGGVATDREDFNWALT